MEFGRRMRNSIVWYSKARFLKARWQGMVVEGFVGLQDLYQILPERGETVGEPKQNPAA